MDKETQDFFFLGHVELFIAEANLAGSQAEGGRLGAIGPGGTMTGRDEQGGEEEMENQAGGVTHGACLLEREVAA